MQSIHWKVKNKNKKCSGLNRISLYYHSWINLLSCFPSLYDWRYHCPFNSRTATVDVSPLIRSDTLIVRLKCVNKCFCAVPSVSITRDYPILPMVNCQTYFPCNSGYEKAAVNSQKLCQQLRSQREKQSLWFWRQPCSKLAAITARPPTGGCGWMREIIISWEVPLLLVCPSPSAPSSVLPLLCDDHSERAATLSSFVSRRLQREHEIWGRVCRRRKQFPRYKSLNTNSDVYGSSLYC